MDEPRDDDPTAKPSASPAPDLAESLRQIGGAGHDSLGAAVDAAKALRRLVSADLSLARSAFGRALAFTGVAIAFGGSTWMLLMATLTAVLHDALGWSWTLSLAVCALLSLAVTVFGAWQAIQYFDYTRLEATRRQLARLGIGEMSDDDLPGPDASGSAREARAPDAQAGTGADATP
ncbi:phage holin family protein [Lysobacter fragariae]